MSESESAEKYWNSLAIGAPARRALINAHIWSREQYAATDPAIFKSLHGIVPKANEILNQAVRQIESE